MTRRLTELLAGLAEAAWGLVYPEACQACGEARATRAEGYVCVDCCRQFRVLRPPCCERCGLPFPGDITTAFTCSNCTGLALQFSRARSVIAAQGLALDLLHRYKYHRARWLEPLLARLLVEAAGPVLTREGWDLLVPVPLHPLKQAEREFNQAERLARALARATGLPMNPRLVRRVTATRTQTRLSRAERSANVHRAFAPLPGASCAGRRVALIDDVLTTGSTTSACAGALRAAGAKEVCVWTLARGLLH
jgi:competence protein ComFC